MLLDTGICAIYHKRNVAAQGEKPRFEDVQYHIGWYGELSFETTPARPTLPREEVRTDARIRVLQNRQINNHDRVVLTDSEGNDTAYEVARAYHGVDQESGEPITDLTLEVIAP